MVSSAIYHHLSLLVVAKNGREVSVPLSISLGIASAGGDPSAPLMGFLAEARGINK